MRRDIAEREESRHELELRATLHARAGEAVDMDTAWKAIVPRLTRTNSPVVRCRHTRPLGGVSRGVMITAAAVVLVVALAGAGAADWGGLFGGPNAKLIGNQQLYSLIGQSQMHGGVTVSIDNAYADPGNIYIAVTFTMRDDRASRYGNIFANSVTVADGAGNEARGLNLICEPLWREAVFHRDGVEHRLMDVGALQPAGAASLTQGVEIGKIWLFPTTDHQPEIVTGPWSFTFSLPFHQQGLGPGGPYAQPGTTTPSTPGTKKP